MALAVGTHLPTVLAEWGLRAKNRDDHRLKQTLTAVGFCGETQCCCTAFAECDLASVYPVSYGRSTRLPVRGRGRSNASYKEKEAMLQEIQAKHMAIGLVGIIMVCTQLAQEHHTKRCETIHGFNKQTKLFQLSTHSISTSVNYNLILVATPGPVRARTHHMYESTATNFHCIAILLLPGHPPSF